MRIYKANELPPPTRVGLYGDPKIGKTRLATDLPWGPRWGEKAVYVASDPGSEELASVLPANRDRLLVVVPGPDGTKAYDPLTEALEIATKDWKKEDPGIGTIIWDTMTYTAALTLRAIAAQQLYGKGMKVGPMPIPQMGDYGATQRSVQYLLGFLFQQPLNIICLFHSELADSESGGLDTLVGGPATVGKAGIRPVAGLFDNLFRISITKERVAGSIPPKYTEKRIVRTDRDGVWLVGMRSPHPTNPIPEVELTENTAAFWQTIDEVKGVK